ncbi:hypothetical protein [Candidatus Sororendozoicomonas aggregata]|uniref:WD40 repeat domain-containing protein n=1 Tax=Candidatus Sororendozoicomonas aggregata TaxID=3073239 RepID=UPI002ED39AE1
MLRYLNKLRFICFFSFFYVAMSLFHCALGNQCYERVIKLDLNTGNGKKKPISKMVLLSDERVALVHGLDTIKVLDFSATGYEACVVTLYQFDKDSIISSLTPLKGQRLVSGLSDGTMKVWDLSRPYGQQYVATLNGHTRWVRAVKELSNDQLFSASEDGTLKVWNLKNRDGDRCVATLSEPRAESVAELSNGRLVSSSADGTLKVWDLREPDGKECVDKVVNVENDEEGDMQSFLLPLAGSRILFCRGNRVANVWDLSKRRRKKVPLATLMLSEAGLLTAVIKLADHRLASCDNNGIKVWDLNKPDGDQCVADLNQQTDVVRDIIQMPNGWLASCSIDGTINLWNLANSPGKQCIGTWKHKKSSGSLMALSDNKLVFFSDKGVVKVWDLNKPVSSNPLRGCTLF